MTPLELKYHVEQTGSHFFERSTMKFFGDRMGNYGVRSKPVVIRTYSGLALVWELYRKQPVKMGLKSSAYFLVDTYEKAIAACEEPSHV